MITGFEFTAGYNVHKSKVIVPFDKIVYIKRLINRDGNEASGAAIMLTDGTESVVDESYADILKACRRDDTDSIVEVDVTTL